MTIKTPLALIRDARYERKIKKSQAHLASIPVAHGHTNVYA